MVLEAARDILIETVMLVLGRDRCFYCQKIKRIVHDERLAFIATTPEAYRVRTTEAYYTFVAFIYDSVYETEPPPWNYC
nr:unnamed protein product [Haemonchus contortus]